LLYAGVVGFVTGMSLILAFGAQNAFVLRQGLKSEHVGWLCLFCSLSDAILISAGVFGFSAVVAFSPNLTLYLSLGGAAFLATYGLFRLYVAWIGEYELVGAAEPRNLGATIMLAAAFTWANPHVYFETVGLIGAMSTSFPGLERWAFGVGAISASFMFFFSLGYGARLLAPVMRSQKAWRVLDTVVGVTMLWLATSLFVAAQ
jgi:L-lysine exporter family protein LysE/ArgO